MNFQLVLPDYMGVDNAAVSGMDYSGLPGNVYIVEWKENHGEIEYSDREAGLRETFIDVMPYAPYLQSFLSKLSNPTLAQAKKLQINFVTMIFESQRQLPFYYEVAEGSFDWESTDGAMASMALQVLPKFSSILLDVISDLSTLATQVNSRFASAKGNDDNIVAGMNALIGTYQGTYAINCINEMLHSNGDPGTPGDGQAAPGFKIDLGHLSTPGAISAVSIPSTTSPAIPWAPIGQSLAVNLSLAEVIGIMGGIAARYQSLAAVRDVKISEINTLSMLQDAIDYDATDGWS